MSPTPCVVALCKNRGTHLLPHDETRRAQWIQAIEHVKPGLTIRKHSKICLAHFQPTDFSITPLSMIQPETAPKTIKKTVIPSIFPWKTIHRESPSTRQDQDSRKFKLTEVKYTYSRSQPIPFAKEQPSLDTSVSNFNEDPLYFKIENTDSEFDYKPFHNNDTGENIGMKMKVEVELDEPPYEEFMFKDSMSGNTETHEISIQTEADFVCGFSIHHYKNNDKAMHFYTGLENFNKVMLVFNSLGECVHKLNYFDGKPPQDLDALEQFFMTLLILRRHKPFDEIAMMYQVPIQQVYNIFITWVRFMSLQWKNLDLWIDTESVKAYTPSDFYDKYSSIRIVLDATECPIKKPKLSFAQKVTYSSCKNRNTVKFVIGVTPSGLISYVSPCYGGSVTDRQIIERSSILSKLDQNDEIMVDKGLDVQDIFEPYGVKVNTKDPSFFKKDYQIESEPLPSNRKVYSKTVHKERIIGLLKTYKILSQPMNKTEIVLSSDIVFICAMLVNFQLNVTSKNI